MGSFWAGIVIGIVIIAAVVGLPLWLVLRRREKDVGRGASTALLDSDQLGPGASNPDATPQSMPEIRVPPPDKTRRNEE